MAILPILSLPHPSLRRPADHVTTFDDQLKKVVADMFETHYATPNCGALAANQLGIPWHITVIDPSENKDEPLCLINAEIIEKSEETVNVKEGCMSVPGGFYYAVERHKTIKFRYQDVDGHTHEQEADDYLSRCVQHELDHLRGVVFTDYLPPFRRKLFMQKYMRKQHR